MTRDEQQKEILRLSLEGTKRGRMFWNPMVLGMDENEWIETAKAAIERIDRETTGDTTP